MPLVGKRSPLLLVVGGGDGGEVIEGCTPTARSRT